MEDSFIGTFHGSLKQLKVVLWDGQRTKGSAKIYTVLCNICKNDTELFGDGRFKSTKGNLLSGRMPCGCAGSRLWTEGQTITRVKRKCDEKSYTLIGFKGGFKGKLTKLHLRCLLDDFEWDTTDVHHFLSSCVGCPMCAKRVIWTESQREHQIVEAMRGTTLAFLNWKSRYKNSTSKFIYKCSEHGEHEVATCSFLNQGVRCPGCAEYGFSKEKPANIYVMTDGELTKLGITNRDIKFRLEEIKRDSGRDFVTLYSENFKDGVMAYYIEYALLVAMRAHEHCTDENFNGSTECFKGIDSNKLIKQIQTMSELMRKEYDYN